MFKNDLHSIIRVRRINDHVFLSLIDGPAAEHQVIVLARIGIHRIILHLDAVFRSIAYLHLLTHL